jgi:tRNA dimethylallyltransferase
MNKVLVITGPTASGKSELALRIAAETGGEIISADSMQLYKGLDIGTAKPSAEERRRTPHHLLDVFDFSVRVDVYTFLELAERAIREIHSRNRLPVVTGGTGMYIRALLYGLDPLPGDRGLRAELDRLYDHDAGFARLKEIMREKSPDDYERWHTHRRKLIRAFEVYTLTGQSMTGLQTLRKPQLRYDAAVWNLVRDREELKQRIALRTGRMLEMGWIDEARTAIAGGLLQSPTAWQALGYGIIGEYLSGAIDYETMRRRIVTATWQFARRQITWFNHQHPEAVHQPYPWDHLHYA